MGSVGREQSRSKWIAGRDTGEGRGGDDREGRPYAKDRRMVGIISADRARARGRESILAELGNGLAWVLGWVSYRQNGGGKHGHGKM